MTETIIISGTSKEEKYASLLPQLKALAEDDAGQLAVLGNIMSALKYGLDFFWVGLYEVKGDSLILGSFQGTVACTKIAFGKGVCGYSWKNRKTVIVEDVNKFEGHIACSSETQSEIALPVFDKKGEIIMVLDVDSEKPANFDKTDEHWLTEVVHIIEKTVNK